MRAPRTDGRFDCRIVHAGQRHDRDMSDVFFEELNRLAKDAIADLRFASEPARVADPLHESKALQHISFVGIAMIDILTFQLATLNRMDRASLPSTAIEDRFP